jgi:soluble lytic murein transglycosylase-like protein
MSKARRSSDAGGGSEERAGRAEALPAAERVSAALFEWETRHFGSLRRGVVSWWRRRRRPLAATAAAATLILFGAAVAAEPQDDGSLRRESRLIRELRELRQTLQSRDGELELARLELNRIHAILEYSKRHRIPADLATAIHDIALSEGIDPALAFSLVRVESGFVRNAVSSAGAVGLTQVMPSTARWMDPHIAYSDLFERDTNLRLGFRYLRMLIEQYDGDMHLALLAYNRGPNRVDDILRSGGDPSNGYARLVRAGMIGTPRPTE